MKNFLKKLVAITATAGLTVSMACTGASADNAENPAGYVYVAVEKFSIGQGYVKTPEKVPFYEGENGLDVVKRAVGEENVAVTVSDWGSYISGFKDTDSEVVLADCVSAVVDKNNLTSRNNEGYLSEFDYTTEGGFMFFLNGSSASVGLDGYAPEDNDVVRVQFSIYNYGADIGCDNSGWGGSASLIGDVNRDAATIIIAQALDKEVDVSDEIEIIADLDSTQEDIDNAVKTIEQKLADVEIPTEDELPTDDEDSTDDENDNSINTGFSMTLVAPIAFTALAVASKKRR